MKVIAPGKLILSGEHAVVYGHPALAMAVNRYVTTVALPQAAPHISFDLSDLSYRRHFNLATLHTLKNRLKQKYKRFLNGEFSIREVLQKPMELAQVAFSLFFEALNIKVTQGMQIRVESTIPIGCGMGSSAATILSIVHAIANHLDVDLSPEAFFRLGLEVENLQHGFSSGLDLRVSLNGGCIYLDADQVYSRPLPNVPMYLVNTGTPKTTTGECVAMAANYFKTSSIGEDFAAVTKAMDAAFQSTQIKQVMLAIQANHLLLTQVGVVPNAIQKFISTVQQIGGAAKICGAGAVDGNAAGVVLIVTENETELASLCRTNHYTLLPIAGESRGVHVI